MRPIARLILLSFALTAGAFTGACDTLETFEFWDAKKKLPGERKPVFPEGVPGVSQGIPPELMRGYQEPTPQAETNVAAPGGEPAATGSTAAEKKVEPKPKPKPVARRKPPPPPAEQAEAPAPQTAPPPSPQPGGTLKPWPTVQPQAAWPTAPSSRFER